MSCPVLGHRSGWGPHRFSCPPHPFGVSGPFLINLLALNSDGGSYIIACIYVDNLYLHYTRTYSCMILYCFACFHEDMRT